jgi:putative iron-dependent peroxidase
MTDQVTAQPGIFAQGTRSHYHLEFDVDDSVAADDIAAAVGRLREPAVTSGGTNIVVGFGPDLWRRIEPDSAPDALAPFEGIQSAAGSVPSTPHDVWVWLHGTGPDILLDTARATKAALGQCATLAAEQSCFVYLDSRDLTGFVDGTENPPLHEAPSVALIPPGEPGEGGAFVITMRWIHDLGAFHALALEEQEGVFGRIKPDSVELDDDTKPPTAHIARVVIEEPGDDGEPEELEIYRRSTPYGTVDEHGLYFVAFSADPSRFTKMLARMYGTSEDGLHDRLTEFTHPASCAFYFAPPLEALAAL